MLLFADQLEELYTLTKDVNARQAFMRALSMAADDRDEPVLRALNGPVVITPLRAR